MADSATWEAATKAYWTGRDLQTQKQIDSGKVDAGSRGAMTGGQHLAPLQQAIAELFRSDPDIGPALTVLSTGQNRLPGYYRRAKDWDVVVLYRGALVAAIEVKSQPVSFSRNFNNRVEEAIGNAADLWHVYREKRLGSIKPWLAFVLVLGSIPESTKTLTDGRALYGVDPVFIATSYIDRYRILLQRLVHEQQYNAGVVVATEPNGGIQSEPVFELSFANLEAEVAGRLAFIKNLPDEAFVSQASSRP